MSLNIQIRTIPHSRQRYETAGDWFYLENGDLHIVVSDMGNWRKEFLLAIHELIECSLCKAADISQEDVDKFDMQYEANRNPKDKISEPGDDPKAPYREQHFTATSIERMLSAKLDIEWEQYEADIQNLFD